MKEIVIISFTKNGTILNKTLADTLRSTETACSSFAIAKYAGENVFAIPKNAKEWVGENWKKWDEILFIGAAGIAVRMIAPWVQDKYKDPAVVVIDEKGTYSIPILSGHVGGANKTAVQIAEILEGTAILTTATDVWNVFAVDSFAVDNQLLITERSLAKKISASLLRGEYIGCYSDYEVKGSVPSQVSVCKDMAELSNYEYAVAILKNGHVLDVGVQDKEHILLLYPRDIVAGIGCRKGISEFQIEKEVRNACNKHGISMKRLGKIASIDLKKEEIGLQQFAKNYQLPFVTFSAEELKQIEHVSGESEFVRQVTGVGNVCERAVMLAACGGDMIQAKQAGKGVTVALAQQEKRSIKFER